MELEGEGLLFWAEKQGNKARIYLISSIRDFLKRFGNEEIRKALKNKDNEKLNSILSSKEEIKNI
ncbi:CRISPR-associated protein, Csx11 family [Methanocaldococcus villosus KIN24-T80]|uniref:CRISPR-associated protein, Csx11 family n=1 Tax=Methanocaldococcus villosus KIN24-T80 TaxID=1069083 RepID=N6VYN3_9EURY|nr:hypothetical protein [Methanocaldococcus villosus]ENN96237.1 CRISPR-associated protein, Csx11 family [Methanocaldococcus villosus KIN24-T80]